MAAASQSEPFSAQNLSPIENPFVAAQREPATNSSAAELKIVALTRQAAIDYREGRYADAEAPLREALSVTQQTFGSTHVEVAVSASNLAIVLANEGQLLEAERFYRMALSIFEQYPTQKVGVPVALTLTNFATLRVEQRQYAAAEKLTRQAIDLWERAPAQFDLSLASALVNLGAVYLMIGRNTEAEALYTRSLRMLESRPERNAAELATTLYNLGTLRARQKSYGEAEAILQRATDLWTKTLGTNHPHLAAALTSLGYVYTMKGQYVEAAQCLNRAIGIREEAFGSASPQAAETLWMQATLLRRTHHRSEARKLEAKALAAINAHAKANQLDEQIDVSTLLRRRK
jgi:tetratricopeptide (TPR) repeat protein